MAWTQGHAFHEPLIDLRGNPEQADVLAAELQREIAPGHALYGEVWRVIAKALPNDDVVVECGDEVAVVHLTGTQKQDRPPWPMTTFIASVEEFESYVESEYD